MPEPDPRAVREKFGASLPPFDAAFLDPDWALSGPSHVYRFQRSNTRPPADMLLQGCS